MSPTMLPFSVSPNSVVRLGPPHADAAGTAVVPVHGGFLTVDPASPFRPPSLSVVDLDEARDVVEDLYGAEALDVCNGPAGSSGSTSCDLSPELGPLTRLGILRWLATCAPWPYDRGVHRLESLVLAARCSPWLDDEPAADLLVGFADPLVDADRRQDELPAVVTALVRDGLAVIAATMVADDPRRSAVVAALARPVPGQAQGRPWPMEEALTESSHLARAGVMPSAAHAGTGEPGAWYTDTTTADWVRVPLGVLDRGEDGVTWVAEPQDDGRYILSVSAAAQPWPQSLLPSLAPSPGPVSGLAFSVHVPTWPLPLGTAGLSHLAEGGTWAGVLSLGQSASTHLRRALIRPNAGMVVDVHAADAPYVPSKAPDPVVAEAFRYAARGVCAARLALVSGDPAIADSASAALLRAARLWDVADGSAAADGTRAADCRAMSDRLRRRLDSDSDSDPWPARAAAYYAGDDRGAPLFDPSNLDGSDELRLPTVTELMADFT